VPLKTSEMQQAGKAAKRSNRGIVADVGLAEMYRPGVPL
jgi:hypothetical protein